MLVKSKMAAVAMATNGRGNIYRVVFIELDLGSNPAKNSSPGISFKEKSILLQGLP